MHPRTASAALHESEPLSDERRRFVLALGRGRARPEHLCGRRESAPEDNGACPEFFFLLLRKRLRRNLHTLSLSSSGLSTLSFDP